MKGPKSEALDGLVLLPKSIDNSKVVREVDPRSNRDLFWLALLVAALVFGLGLYAWPHLALREAGIATDQMLRERERLIEENRKLHLEKASLESLGRVDAIAHRELGLVAPPAEKLVVVERPAAVPSGAQIAGREPQEAPRN